MDGIIVQARGYHREATREWEKGQVFRVTTEDLLQHRAALQVLTPEQVDAYRARGGPEPAFLAGASPSAGPREGAQEAAGDAQEAEEGESPSPDGQHALDGPEFDRSMAGKAGVRRRNG